MGPKLYMRNGIIAQGAVSAAMDGGFSVCEGIQFDADVCTPEDERMEAIKQNILRKLAARLDSGPFRRRPGGLTTAR